MDRLLEFATNHFVLVALFFALLGLLIANLWSDLTAAGKQVAVTDAVLLINREGAVVVDVREAADFAGGHLPEARNMPLKELPQRLSELEAVKGRPLIVCAGSASAAAQAARVLEQAGFGPVYRLRGGLQSWSERNLPLVREGA